MQEYELTVLVHPDLEKDLEKTLKGLRALVTDNGGKITSEDNWGKKKLAYTIQKEDFAVYVAFDVQLPAEAPQKISTTLNITDGVLRYLLVKVDEKERSKRAAAKENAADASSDDKQEEE